MNYEDLKEYNFSVFKGYGENRVEVRGELMDRALDLIDIAVDKQIPMDKISDCLSHTGYRCPACDSPVWRDEQFCPTCGQKLNVILEDPTNLSKEEENIVLGGFYTELIPKYN